MSAEACLSEHPDPVLEGATLRCTMSKGHAGIHVATVGGFLPGLTRQADLELQAKAVRVAGDVLAVWS